MNKVLFVILTLLTILRAQSNAQVTYHFQHTGGVWGQFNGSYYYPCPGCQGLWVGGTYYLYSMGDTVINGISYIKIYSGDSLGNTLFLSTLIREDTLGNVWWYDPLIDADSLLYDFTVNTGDTVNVSEPYGYPYLSLLVDSVATIMINGYPRKAIFFDQYFANGGCCAGGGYNNEPLIWIEGIGSTGGLMFPDGSSSVVDALEFLTCYKQNDTLFFGDQCNVVYTNAPIPDNQFTIKISPNPASDNIFLSINLSSSDGEVQLELSDLLGRMVHTEIISLVQNSVVKQISVDQIPAGSYFLRLKSEKYSAVKIISIVR